jgi:RimJ/RimL family protein N-acetyltransferase
MMIVAPTVQTPRLILRAQQPSDTEPLMAAFADDDYSRFITRDHRALTREEAWRPIATVPGMWAVSGYGQWMVEEKATGLAVGRLGPWQPEGWPDFEIGWSIFPQHQGKGFAVEGAAAAFLWAHQQLGRDHAIHLIDPANVASERVAAKLGGAITGTWELPGGGDANVWTTRWESFIQTEAYTNQLSAGA